LVARLPSSSSGSKHIWADREHWPAGHRRSRTARGSTEQPIGQRRLRRAREDAHRGWRSTETGWRWRSAATGGGAPVAGSRREGAPWTRLDTAQLLVCPARPEGVLAQRIRWRWRSWAAVSDPQRRAAQAGEAGLGRAWRLGLALNRHGARGFPGAHTKEARRRRHQVVLAMASSVGPRWALAGLAAGLS
jgi:hypothetical protein